MKTYSLGNWIYWYDRYTRCWWAAEHDDNDNQIGNAIDAYTKREIILLIKQEQGAAA